MVEKQNIPAKRRPFEVLMVFAIAFTLQGMSLAVFHGDRPARSTDPAVPRTALMMAPVMATKTFTVTTLEDGGPGSLRQAILDANATPGLDEIRFAFSEPVTITLYADLPVITDPISIEAHGPWLTDTLPGWLTIDGSNVSGDVFVVSDAAGTSIRRLRLVNFSSGYGFSISGGSEGTVVISNTIQNGMGGIQLQNTGQITVTHNTLLDLLDAAVEAKGSDEIWFQENKIRNIGGTGIRLLDGVRDAVIISNTLSGILNGTGISAAGNPAPTGVLMRSNTFTDTVKPISLGPGANGGFPAPEILQAFLLITPTTTFSARSPADPITYTYPLLLDLYRVRNGNYTPLGINVLYDVEHFPAPITYTVTVTDVLVTDQLAVIATTANPSTSEFSPPVVFSLPPPPSEDQDDDGVDDDADLCPGTVIPEATVPSVRLGVNHFALVDDDFDFDTTPPNGNGPKRSYTTTDTGGCSCEQILDALGLGKGHSKFGCSIGVMDGWVADVSAAAKQGSGADAARTTTAPETYVLEQNYPNPFNPTTRITFQVPEPRHVLLRVFDMLGREVTTLVNKDMGAGTYQVEWDGRNAQGRPVASGVYLYRIEAGDFSGDKTMILLR